MYEDKTAKERADELKSQNEHAALLKDYQRTFSSVPGTVVLKNLITRYVMGNAVDVDNPHRTYYNEGKRAVVTEIMQIMNMDVDAVYTAMRENANE